MNKILHMAMAGLLALGVSGGALAAEVQSLRGGDALDSSGKSFDQKKQLKQKGGFERSFEQQPPMIPHSIEKDQITLKVNTCLKCHSEQNYEKEKAPKAGDSHYVDRDGNVLQKISSRRWFCEQCHAPQADAEPLVDNQF